MRSFSQSIHHQNTTKLHCKSRYGTQPGRWRAWCQRGATRCVRPPLLLPGRVFQIAVLFVMYSSPLLWYYEYSEYTCFRIRQRF